MTALIKIEDVITAIVGIAPTGITFVGLDKIPASGELITPICFPDPSNPISEPLVTRNSQGIGQSSKYTITYNINYIYLHAPVADDFSGLFDYTTVIRNIVAIMDAFVKATILNGAVEFTPPSNVRTGTIQDPSENAYYGAAFSVGIMQFIG